MLSRKLPNRTTVESDSTNGAGLCSNVVSVAQKDLRTKVRGGCCFLDYAGFSACAAACSVLAFFIAKIWDGSEVMICFSV